MNQPSDTAEKGKVCPKCRDRGFIIRTGQALLCPTCQGEGTVTGADNE